MKYVLDASVGLKTVLPEAETQKVLDLIADFKRQIHELIAPDTYLIECAHALTRAERRGLILPPDGHKKFQLIADACPDLFSYIPLLPRAFDISSSMRLGAYDCLYLALAEQEGCQLITADKKLVDTFPTDVIDLATL